MTASLLGTKQKVGGLLGVVDDHIAEISAAFISYVRPVLSVALITAIFLRVAFVLASNNTLSALYIPLFATGFVLSFVVLLTDFRATIGIIRNEQQVQWFFFPVSDSPQHISISIFKGYIASITALAVHLSIDVPSALTQQLCSVLCNVTANVAPQE